MNLYDDLAWENADGYPEGTLKKQLRNDDKGVTMLLKLPPKFHMPLHSHLTVEQHFVISGEYTSDNKTFKAGCYQMYKAGEEHGPFKSEKGALIIVIWDK